MIASYLHNFVFIKTKKTASTVVEMVLGNICGPNDIVTPLGPDDEVVRNSGKLVCRNFASDPTAEQAMKTAVLNGDAKAFKKSRRKCEFYSHMTAGEIKAHLDPEFWNNAYKVTIERHPYERAVSQAYFCHHRRRDPPFRIYLDSFLHEGRYVTYKYYTIDGAPIIDKFLRQEFLHQDLKELGEIFGFPVPTELPRTKNLSRRDRRPASEILSDEQKKIVYDLCRPEFDLHGYRP